MNEPRKRKRRTPFLLFGLPLLSLPFALVSAGVVVVTGSVVIASLVLNGGNSKLSDALPNTPSSRPTNSPAPSRTAGPSPSPSASVTLPISVYSPSNPGAGAKGGTGVNGATDTDVVGSTSRISLSIYSGISLRPGRTSPLNMSFTNEDSKSVAVDHLTVTISSLSAPSASATRSCSMADFFVTQVPPSFSVLLRPSASVNLLGLGTAQSSWPAVGMVDSASNQDGCKGATLTLTYKAWGNNE